MSVADQQLYEIRVRGHLGETILGAFPSLDAETSGDTTLLRGTLVDRSALYGVLAQIEALGLELLEVRQLPRRQRRRRLTAMEDVKELDPRVEADSVPEGEGDR